MKKQRLFIIMFIALSLISGTLSSQTDNREARIVTAFTEVSFSIPGEMYIKSGPEYRVELVGDKSVIDNVITEVTGKKLIIKKDDWTFNFNEKVILYITMPQVDGLSVSGSGKAVIEEGLNSGSLKLSVSGSGRVVLSDLESENLSCDISGSGNIIIEGNGHVKNAEITISGSGNYTGQNLILSDVGVHVSGSGNCECNVTKSLIASVSGSGDIFYFGNPKIDARISGSGHIRSR
jgi:hypothetical protein